MKKYLFLVSVAALTFSSCSDQTTEFVGEQQAREISFAPVAKPVTRTETTAAIADAVYPDNLVMQVAAYAFPKTSSTWTAGGYFDKTPFDGTNATSWKGTPARYWPLSDAYVSFLAVAGVDAADVSFTASTFASGATATYDADSFTAQTDLMYAGKQEEVTKTGNSLGFPDDVDMEFKHALAWLQFNVRVPAGAGYGSAIAVTKIVINDANKTGTFTITNTGYDTAGDPTPSGTWGSFAAAADYDVPSSAKATLSNSAFEACGAALLVPKASPATSFAKFTIYYTIDGKAYTFDYTPASLVLAQATKYVYNITFTLTEIEIDPVVTPWTNAAETPIAVPTPAA